MHPIITYILTVKEITMPFKKVEWGDIPHETYVKDKDIMGKWIECDICNVKIRIRSQFCFTEWDTHCSGVKHCRIANCETLKKNYRIDTFLKKGQQLKQIHLRMRLIK